MDWINKTWSDKTWINKTWSDKIWINKTWSDKTWSDKTWSNKIWSNKTWINKTWINKTWINKTWSDIARIYDQVRKGFFPQLGFIGSEYDKHDFNRYNDVPAAPAFCHAIFLAGNEMK